LGGRDACLAYQKKQTDLGRGRFWLKGGWEGRISLLELVRKF